MFILWLFRGLLAKACRGAKYSDSRMGLTFAYLVVGLGLCLGLHSRLGCLPGHIASNLGPVLAREVAGPRLNSSFSIVAKSASAWTKVPNLGNVTFQASNRLPWEAPLMLCVVSRNFRSDGLCRNFTSRGTGYPLRSPLSAPSPFLALALACRKHDCSIAIKNK